MPKNRLRIGALENDKYARAGILIDLRNAGFEAWATGDEAEFLRLLEEEPPAAVLLDISLGEGELAVRGLEYIRKIKRERPEIKCIVLTAFRVLANFQVALKAKVDSYIVKETAVDLADIVRRVLDGEVIRDAALLDQLADEGSQGQGDDDAFTPRELDVFRILASNPEVTNETIAETLGIRPDTVKTHLSKIFLKLNVGNRRDAVLRGRALGLLT